MMIDLSTTSIAQAELGVCADSCWDHTMNIFRCPGLFTFSQDFAMLSFISHSLSLSSSLFPSCWSRYCYDCEVPENEGVCHLMQKRYFAHDRRLSLKLWMDKLASRSVHQHPTAKRLMPDSNPCHSTEGSRIAYKMGFEKVRTMSSISGLCIDDFIFPINWLTHLSVLGENRRTELSSQNLLNLSMDSQIRESSFF
jgi:hypothetical protein